MRTVLIVILSISLFIVHWQLSDYREEYNIEKENMELCETTNSIAKTQAKIVARSDVKEAIDSRFDYCFWQAKTMIYTWSEARYYNFLLCSTDLQ